MVTNLCAFIILTYPVTLSFKPMNNNKERNLSGDSFCTYYGGDYKINASKGTLELAELITQDMMCDKGNQQMDNLFFDKLQMVSNYKLENNLLKLYSGEKSILIFNGQLLYFMIIIVSPIALLCHSVFIFYEETM